MSEICPACGFCMLTTEKAFAMNDKPDAAIVTGVPHLECPRCGQITFTPEQLRALHKVRTAQRAEATA